MHDDHDLCIRPLHPQTSHARLEHRHVAEIQQVIPGLINEYAHCYPASKQVATGANSVAPAWPLSQRKASSWPAFEKAQAAPQGIALTVVSSDRVPLMPVPLSA